MNIKKLIDINDIKMLPGNVSVEYSDCVKYVNETSLPVVALVDHRIVNTIVDPNMVKIVANFNGKLKELSTDYYLIINNDDMFVQLMEMDNIKPGSKVCISSSYGVENIIELKRKHGLKLDVMVSRVYCPQMFKYLSQNRINSCVIGSDFTPVENPSKFRYPLVSLIQECVEYGGSSVIVLDELTINDPLNCVYALSAGAHKVVVPYLDLNVGYNKMKNFKTTLVETLYFSGSKDIESLKSSDFILTR